MLTQNIQMKKRYGFGVAVAKNQTLNTVATMFLEFFFLYFYTS